MLKISVFIACLVAIAATASVPTGNEKKVEADKDFLIKQKGVLQLLSHVHQPSVVPELKEITTNFDLEQNVNNFNDVETVKHFVKTYKSGSILGRRNTFSPLYKSHAQQVKTVFEVLYNAKDWTTFYNTAAWLREHINDGVFVYAFSVAIIHRPDTQNIILPPLYEVRPHLFVNAKTIQRAYETRMKINSKTEGKDSLVIPTNYTGWYTTNTNPEIRTCYYTEDVGLNFYHYIYHLTYPSWLKKEHYGIKNERQGELFWYVHQQLLAHYKLERLTNDMYPMKNFTLEQSNVVAYTPQLRYQNGEGLPTRPENIKIQDTDVTEIEHVRNLRRRIVDAIDSGYVQTVKGEKVPLTSETGIDILGRIIENTTTSVHPKYYGSLYHLTLGLLSHIVDPYHQNQVAPGTLDHFETMLRDPMYYRLYQSINKLFIGYKNTLTPYTQEKLTFPGVTVEGVDVDKLMTYFENFDIDITNAVTIGKVEDDKTLKIIARQPRLNHKEFTYRITVNSNQDVVGMVRVFLAPKYDVTGKELGLNERRKYLIQIDRFPQEIKSGKTVIERSSKDSTITVPDMTSFRVLYKQVEDAIQGKSPFYPTEKGHQYGYPSRLLIPKGKKSGMQYVMYVVVTPYTNEKTTETIRGIKTFVTCGGDVGCGDSYPLGYPFDRQISETDIHTVPNFYQTDVTIYHKKMEDHSANEI